MCGRIYDPSGCGGTSTLAKGATFPARWPYGPSQSTISQWGWVWHTVRSGIGSGNHFIRSRGVADVCNDSTSGMGFYPPQGGENSTLARGECLPARWPYEPQSIGGQPMGVGFQHCAGRYRPGESPFLFLGCWNCRCMVGFMTRRWDLIIPGCGGTSTLF